MPSPNDPQSLNRYTYTLNNPVKYNDPTGHDVDCGIGDDRLCRARASSDILDSYGWDENRPTWDQISSYEREALAKNGMSAELWDSGPKDLPGEALTNVAGRFPEDPATLIPIGGGLKIGWTLLKEIGVSTVAACAANEACRNSFLEQSKALGQAGERAAGIIKNTVRIPSLTGTATYRIPDQLLPAQRLLSEVKNVAHQGLTNQLRDYLLYAQQQGYTFELWVRETTILSSNLQGLVDKGEISLRYLP